MTATARSWTSSAATSTSATTLASACAVYVDGRLVVDLWAGIADRRTGRAFEHDTATVIFSCTKGVMAVCAYLLVQEGLLELDSPIARYWPEFAQAGKERITVRDAMAHRAGLSYLDTDLTLEDVEAWDPVIRAIEIQRPHWAPRTGHAYHASTIGWLLGETIRRITGLSAGTYFRQALGDPLGLHTWIGLPASERARVAWMEPPLPDEDSEMARGIRRPGGERHLVRAMSLGKAFAFPAADGSVTFNDPRIQASEIPGRRWDQRRGLARAPVRGMRDRGRRGRAPADACLDRRRPARAIRGPAADRPAERRGALGVRLPDHVAAVLPDARLRQLRSYRGRRAARLRRRRASGELRLPDEPDGRLRRPQGDVADRCRPRCARCLIRAPGDAVPRDPYPELSAAADVSGLARGHLATLGRLSTGRSPGCSSGVHVLPPFPSSGDRGFAPITYDTIDPRFGTWADIEDLGRAHDVLLDVMVNHLSRQSAEFRDFEREGARSPSADLFITLDKVWPDGEPPAADVARIFLRKPTGPFSTVTIEATGGERIWTSFGTAEWSEQIDLDVDVAGDARAGRRWLRSFAAHGVRIVRLDAVGYVIKKAGTSCFMVEPEI